MIIVSAGMQKSGSGWYFNLTNDLLVAAGYQDARVVREKFRLQPLLKDYNCNIGRLRWFKIALLTIPHFLGNTFVIKTHNRPTPSLRFLMSKNIVKATYIYRDPRDAAISAFEHGQEIRSQGERHTFGKLDNVESAVLATKRWLAVWDKWMECDSVLSVRYEDLLGDTINELERLANFLSIDVSSIDLNAIVATYQRDRLGADQKGFLHFNKGRAERFREVMSQKELDLCQKYFGDYLVKMGYSFEKPEL